MLLCGSTGTGKTHLAYKVSEMLFKLGSHSKFFLHIQSNIHFINQKSLAQNQEQLIQTLKRQIVKSPSSIFVIDEVDKLPKGFLDVMAPLLAHNGNFEGLDFTRAVFIFISNIGGDQINAAIIKNGIFRGNQTFVRLSMNFTSKKWLWMSLEK